MQLRRATGRPAVIRPCSHALQAQPLRSPSSASQVKWATLMMSPRTMALSMASISPCQRGSEPSQTQTRHAARGPTAPPAQPRTWRHPRVRIAQRAPWRLHGRVCARPRPPEATRTQSGVCAPPPRQQQKTPALLTVSGGWGRRRSSAPRRYIITPLTSAKHRKDPV